MPIKSTRSKVTIIRQLCELIPPFMVAKLATEHGIRSRAITPWSHVVSLVYAQFTHALGLNDVCDSLNANRSGLYLIRGATPPARMGSLTQTEPVILLWPKVYSGSCLSIYRP